MSCPDREPHSNALGSWARSRGRTAFERLLSIGKESPGSMDKGRNEASGLLFTGVDDVAATLAGVELKEGLDDAIAGMISVATSGSVPNSGVGGKGRVRKGVVTGGVTSRFFLGDEEASEAVHNTGLRFSLYEDID
jgi:hypothetical protein